MRHSFCLVLMVAASACALDLGVPQSLQVTCTNNAQCPEGTICDTNVGSCVASETPSLRVDVPDQLSTRYTRAVPFEVQIVSANAGALFDLQLEFRLLDEPEVAWRALTLAPSSSSPAGVVGSPSGTTHAFLWDALADATLANGLALARVDLDADGQVADPIVRAEAVAIRAVARSGDGAVQSVPAESAPFSVGNEPPVATIDAVIGETGVINVVVGLVDSNADACGFELQFRGPDGVWRTAALAYGNTEGLGCRAETPLAASVGWRSNAPLFAPEVEDPSVPQGVGDASIPNTEQTARVVLRARAYDTAEASTPEQHWGVWSPPQVLTRVVNQTPPVVLAAGAARTAIIGGTGPIHIRYTLADAQSDDVNVTFEYSHDAGTHWYRCEEYAFALSEGTRDLATAPLSGTGGGGVEHLFSWDASRGNTVAAASTVVRLTVDDDVSAATTFAFTLGTPATPSGDAPHDAFVRPLFTSDLLRSNGVQSGQSYDVAIADFDNDGAKDLVFAKPEAVANSAFSIFRNGGTTVPWPQTFLAGSAEKVIAGNFLNNPARQSLVSMTTAGVATLWAGNGNMTFASDTTFDVGAEPYDVIARDLDADGDDDLVVTRDEFSSLSLLVFLNTGVSGSRFSSSPSFTATYDARFSAAVGDLDGDGILDIAVALQSSDGRLLAGDGTGNFAEVGTFLSFNSNDPDTLGIGEANGDGIADLINLGNGELIYHLGTGGPGAFTYDERRLRLEQQIASASFADLNGDGLTDIAGHGGGLSSIAIALGGFDAVSGEVVARSSEVPFDTFGVFADDLDSDGVAEIVALTGNGVGAMAVLRVDGPATVGGALFRSGAAFLPSTSIGFPMVANLDADGVVDLVYIDNALRLRRGLGGAGIGDAAFGEEEIFQVADQALQTVDGEAADLNGDGIVDLVVLFEVSNSVPFQRELWLGWVLSRPVQGIADARFEALQSMQISALGMAEAGGLAVADFDADGRLDVAYLYNDDFASSAWELGVAFNRGGPIFSAQDATYAIGNPARNLEVGYVGADALPDLLAAVPSDGEVRLFASSVTPVNRANPFTATSIVPAGSMSEAHFADLNWDGVTDLWTRFGTLVQMRNGIAGGGFSGVTSFFPNSSFADIQLFDASLDGINDFVMLGFPFAYLGAVAAGTAPGGVPANGFANPVTFNGTGFGDGVTSMPRDVNCDAVMDLVAFSSGQSIKVLAGTRDFFTPQLAVYARPYDGGHQSTLASLGFSGVRPLHPWHVAPAAPCGASGRWEDELRAWRVAHGGSPRFRILSPARWLGETARYKKTRVGDALRVLRTPRFTPPLDLGTDGAPRGLVATLTVARARRASVIPTRLRVYRQSEALLSAADVIADPQHSSPDAARMLPQMPTRRGLADVIDRRWSWELIPQDSDGDLRTGTGRRYVYDASGGFVDILADEGGLYVVVEEL